MIRKLIIVFCFSCISLINQGHSEEKIEGFTPYLIKKGDTLSKISPKKYWDIIQRVNRIDEKHLIVGRRILVPEVSGEAVKFPPPVPEKIQSSGNNGQKKALYFFLDIQYFAAYQNNELWLWGPISSGKKGSTPKGEFKVLWKRRYYVSRKYGMPMPYAVNFSEKGYFFHQQSLPGRPASHGCVRLLEVDAERLFNWIEKNNPVIVMNKSSFQN